MVQEGDYRVLSTTANVARYVRSNDLYDFQNSEIAKFKRTRLSPEFEQDGENEYHHEQQQSCVLGLSLTRTPSWLNLVDQMALSQERQKINCSTDTNYTSNNSRSNFASQSMSEKLKASNFPASLLRIGGWQRTSKYEGDLIAKCYFAKRKLVWEVLEGALKSKIELQWTDIAAIRATIRENEPGILEIELYHPPSFFRETNPQPRKHTLWQNASDFTGGQASCWRRHYVQFPPGVLDKHYEKLLQCDQRLHSLSQKPFPTRQTLFPEADFRGFYQNPFDGYGVPPQSLQRLQYAQQVHPSIFNHTQSFNLSPQAQARITTSNSPTPVMDHHRQRMLQVDQGLTNAVMENYVQDPLAADVNYANNIVPGYQNYVKVNSPISSDNYTLNHVERGEEPRYEDPRVFEYIKQHLLGDPQVGYTSDKMFVTNPQYPMANNTCSSQEMLAINGGVFPDQETINMLALQSATESITAQPQMNNSPVSFGMVDSTIGDLSMAAADAPGLYKECAAHPRSTNLW